MHGQIVRQWHQAAEDKQQDGDRVGKGPQRGAGILQKQRPHPVMLPVKQAAQIDQKDFGAALGPAQTLLP